MAASFYTGQQKFVEALDSSTGVNELLLARVERVALIAELDANLGDGSAGHEGVAARATDRALHVLGMDSRFHAGTPYDLVLVTDQGIRRLGFRPRQNNCDRIAHLRES